VRARTQSSIAVSADGRAWFLLNVSPDIRQQFLDFPALGPGGGIGERGSGIAGCVLTDAELDHTAGLLLLREGGTFTIHCTATVRRWLNQSFPVEPILACFSRPTWCELPKVDPVELPLLGGIPSGLRVRAFELDRHVPRFIKEGSDGLALPDGSVIGLEVEDTRVASRLVYAPCLASLGRLGEPAQRADCLMIDGTFWNDEEPIICGIGSRTAQAMGHLPVSGRDGSLCWLSESGARYRVYVHINNTNPMLNEHGPEYRLVGAHGVRVGADGDCFDL